MTPNPRVDRREALLRATVWVVVAAVSVVSWYGLWAGARALMAHVDAPLAALLAGQAGLVTALLGATMTVRTALQARASRLPVAVRRPTGRR